MIEFIFLVLGAMILLSFAGNILFRITKIPEILFLILGGVLIGPVLNIVNPSEIIVYAPLITALMLIVIMLDNGLNFNIIKVAKAIPITSLFGLGIMTATFIALTLIFNLVFLMPLILSAIVALILSGTTTDVITTLVSKMSVSKNTKQLLIFESVINDLQIIPFFILLHYAQYSSVSAYSMVNSIFFQLPLTIVIAAVIARIWVYAIDRYLGKHELNYVATLGILFVLYSTTQMIGGNGAIAVLTFSLIFGNALHLFKKSKLPFQIKNKFTIRVLTQFKQIEIDTSFFVKTIFFVFLGIIFSFQALGKGYIFMSVILLLAILACRCIVVHVLCSRKTDFKKDRGALLFIMPRGYVAAVLAFSAASSGLFTDSIVDIVLLNIFITTFVSIAYSMYRERKKL